MRNFQRVMAIVLCLASLLGLLSGCAGVSDNTMYATKGEFFAMFITEKGLYSTKYTNEEIAANETYELEAEVMYEWILIEEDQKGNLSDGVTRDLVAQVCVRFMSFREECVAQAGEAPKIKDLDMCYDKQAVQDAVTLGIFTLSNGYFDGAEKMTYEQCYAAMDTTDSVSNNVEATEELKIEYQDNVYDISDVQIEDIVFYTEEEAAEQLGITETSVAAQNLTASGNVQLAPMQSSNKQYAEIKIPVFEYNKNAKKYQVGNILRYDPFDLGRLTGSFTINDLENRVAGIIVEVEPGEIFVTITLKECSIEQLVKDTDGINRFATMKAEPINEDFIQEEHKDFYIGLTESKKGVELELKHTFTLNDPIYTKQTWRNPEAKPSVTLNVTVDNFSITTKNLGKLLLGKSAAANLKINFNSSVSVEAHAGGMRFSPANNGNGGPLACIAAARWTGGEAGGSQAIKLGKIEFPLGASGFSITLELALVIRMDGSARIVATMANGYEIIAKKNIWGSVNVTSNDISSSPVLESIDVNANIYAGFELRGGVAFWKKEIADVTGAIGVNCTARASVFNKASLNLEIQDGYASEKDLQDLSDYMYCIHSEWALQGSISFCTGDSVIADVIRSVYKKSLPSLSITVPLGSNHFEDGVDMSSCSRGNAGAVPISGDKEIHLETYKVILAIGDEESISITAVPINDKKIENADGIVVESGNKSVVKAYYNENTKIIDLVAKGEGSTEITIKIKKKKGSKEFYMQTISVTVYAEQASGTVAESQMHPGTGSIVVLDAWLSDKSRRC